MKNRKNKLASFVPLGRPLLSSLAFTSLCSSAKIAYAYFLSDKKNAHEDKVILTFSQAKNLMFVDPNQLSPKLKRSWSNMDFLIL